MPRNGSGTMSVPNSFSSGTTIVSAQVNANFADFASEVTGSLPRDGQASMTGQLKSASGSAAAPGITFGADTDTGLFRKSGNTIGIAAGGSEVGTIDTEGIKSVLGLLVPIPTGVYLPYGALTAPTGWVRCNALTIGNASSGATERANADTESLFSFLWNNYSDTVCPVSSGRGASAAADYAANKTITLLDMRGRAPFGLDDMGNTAAGRLGTVITSPTTNGASGGTETHTLTVDEMPAHDHDGATGSNGAKTISITTAVRLQGTGTGESYTVPGGSTATSDDHTHSIPSQGGGSAHSNMPPALLTPWIIKL